MANTGSPPPKPPSVQGAAVQPAKPPRARRSGWHALFYWTGVAGVWGGVFLVAFLVVFARGLPDTSRLYDIRRQPSITYLDRSGAP